MYNLYPLTHPQKRIWYVEKTFPGTGVANIAATVRIKENVDYSALSKALNHVVKINEAMRTRIIEQGSKPMQYFSPYEEFKLDFADFSGKPIESLYEWDTKLSRIPMPFIDTPLFYFAMFKLNDSDGGFYSKIHHFITDAWTEMLLCSQIMNAYRAFSEGREPEQVSNYSYVDYIMREQKYLDSERFHSDKAYWINEFTPVPEIVTLQTKKPAKKSLDAKRQSFVLTRDDAERIRLFCKENKITVFSFLLTMLTIYINRITSSNDIVVGTPVLNRLNSQEKQMTGMFISTVPLCFRIDENSQYIDYARNINASWLSILRHQQYPYDLLQHDLRKNNNSVENLFEITISYQNAKLTKDLLLWDGSTRWHFSGYQNDPLTIHINDHDDNGVLILNYDYNTNCFADREIHFIHSHFKSLIDDALDNPGKPIKSLSLIGQEELQRIEEFNSTYSEYDRSLTFVDLFEQQADQTPDAEALIFHDQPVTFSELDQQANRLAYHLRNRGILRDEIIAVMLPRSIELVSSLLGVLKAGAAFLPIDPSYPHDRINYMLGNSGAKYIITSLALAEHFEIDAELLILPNDPALRQAPSSRLPKVNKPEDLVYIIYTSGSTGLPKGVMVKHSGLGAYIHALDKIMYFQPGEAVLSLCTIAFDIFIFEVFPSLINGMKVVIADENEQRLPALQKELMIKHNIVKFLGTPVRMKMLLDDPGSQECFACLKEVMLGGDSFPEALLKKMQSTLSAKILNGYGPTEITIGATFKDLTEALEINIGRPIANTKIYILDKNMNMVPIGIPGEIYIGGEGLARGYLNNPELTAEKFIDNPFSPGEKLYRTGDLGRWYPKGEIAFLGRIDSQVKIRGHRIELGEIENAIRQFGGISDAVVLDIEDRGRKALYAYIVPSKGCVLDLQQLRKGLFKKLPNFMVPSYYTVVDAIPLNSNGKIDRRSLPAPDNSKSLQQKFEPLNDPTEIRLAAIWEQILDIREINAAEDFFELGGDSLDVVSLVTAIHGEFGTEMTISDIYDNPTLRMQGDKLRLLQKQGNYGVNCPNILALRKNSDEAKKLFFVHAGNGEITNYQTLCQLLNKDYSYYGVRYLTNSTAPQNKTIPEIAGHYIEQLRTVQRRGPYYLCGWCIGGTIVFEMARQLEEAGEQVALVALINSIGPRVWDNTRPYSAETELDLLQSFLNGKTDFSAANNLTLQEIWQSGIDTLQTIPQAAQNIRLLIPSDVSLAIPNFENTDIATLIRYVNIIRTLHNARAFYKPTGLLKTKINFFEVSANDVIADKDANLNSWQRYCTDSIKRIPIEGDHFSIFGVPYIKAFAEALNSVLEAE